MKPFPEIETDRLRLRELAAGDVAGILAVYGDPQVTQYSEMITLSNPTQAQAVIGQFHSEFTRESGIRWAIAQKSFNTLIGTCGLGWYRTNYSAILSYDLARGFWNRGLATEAMRAVVHHCFNASDVNRISATTLLDNPASIRVLQKLGFQEEGVLREWGFWKGKFVDLRCFSLLRKDLGQKTV